jgi:hypothetical protein
MMAFGRLELMDAKETIPASLPIVTERFYEELLRRNYIRTPAMAALRRGVMELVGGFDPSCSPSADYDLWLRVARRYQIVPYAALVARYRQHSANMSRDPRLMLPATLRVLKRQRRFVWHQPALRAAHLFGPAAVPRVMRRATNREVQAALHGGRRRRPGVRPGAGAALSVRRDAPPREEGADRDRSCGRATPAAETTAPGSSASAIPGNR